MGKFKHGLYKHRLHAVRTTLIGRCYNINSHRYENYGARGITVCDEWRVDFKSFYDYVMSLPNAMKKGYTLDRRNNDGNYEPWNMRWATPHEQAVNQRKYSNNTSGYIGVRFRTDNRKWVAYISVRHERITVGHFETLEESVIARNNYIIQNGLSEYKIQPLKNSH